MGGACSALVVVCCTTCEPGWRMTEIEVCVCVFGGRGQWGSGGWGGGHSCDDLLLSASVLDVRTGPRFH